MTPRKKSAGSRSRTKVSDAFPRRYRFPGLCPLHQRPERARLSDLAESDAEIQISAVAWYEFARGPRTAEQLAVARSFFSEEGIIPFSEELAATAADIFRRRGSPRRRAADIAIGVTATSLGAVLLTRNADDFDGVPDLKLECPAAG